MNESLKKAFLVLLGLMIFSAVILSALRVLERSTESPDSKASIEEKIQIKSQHEPPFYTISADGAVRPKSNIVLNHKKSVDGDELFSVDYKTGSFGRRQTPKSDNPVNSHLIMIGCSYTFGHGLKSDETLPYYLGQKFKNSKPYNYGMLAYGTYHITRLIESIDLRNEVEEEKGVMIYQFLNFHIVRSTGRHYWSYLFPYTPVYELNGEELNYVSLRKDRDKATTFFLKAFKRVPLLPSLTPFRQMVNNSTNNRTFYETYAQAIQNMKSEYLKSFPKGRFLMMVHPDESVPTYLQRILEDKGIEMLNFDFSLTDAPQYFIHPDYDAHPAPSLNQKLAESIHQKLNK